MLVRPPSKNRVFWSLFRVRFLRKKRGFSCCSFNQPLIREVRDRKKGGFSEVFGAPPKIAVFGGFSSKTELFGWPGGVPPKTDKTAVFGGFPGGTGRVPFWRFFLQKSLCGSVVVPVKTSCRRGGAIREIGRGAITREIPPGGLFLMWPGIRNIHDYIIMPWNYFKQGPFLFKVIDIFPLLHRANKIKYKINKRKVRQEVAGESSFSSQCAFLFVS